MKYNHLLLVTSLLMLASPAFAEALPPRLISVTGEAEEDAVPDRAVLSGSLQSKAKQLTEAKQQNDRLADKVLVIAKEFKIPKENVSASNVYISPEYVWNQGKNKQEQVGYIVTRNLSITMDKLDVHERVLSALVEQGVDQVNGVSFTISNPQARSDKLRVQAVQNARARAQMLAEAAGAKLGRVMSISVGGATPMPVPMLARVSMAKAEMAGDSVAPSLPGVSHLQETVSMTFELE